MLVEVPGHSNLTFPHSEHLEADARVQKDKHVAAFVRFCQSDMRDSDLGS
jgi:hypothetical protein